jgi:Tripartite tricarboxylate transporter family receptor
MARLPVALVVDAASPIRTVKELIEHVRAHPQQSSWASPGVGTPHHLAIELFKRSAGLQLPAVPYKGGAAALNDLLGGHVTTMMLDLGSGLASIRAGKLRVLAVATPQRATALPDAPTLDELGYKGSSVQALQALIGPAGMPDATVKVLNAECGVERHAHLDLLEPGLLQQRRQARADVGIAAAAAHREIEPLAVATHRGLGWPGDVARRIDVFDGQDAAWCQARCECSERSFGCCKVQVQQQKARIDAVEPPRRQALAGVAAHVLDVVEPLAPRLVARDLELERIKVDTDDASARADAMRTGCSTALTRGSLPLRHDLAGARHRSLLIERRDHAQGSMLRDWIETWC